MPPLDVMYLCVTDWLEHERYERIKRLSEPKSQVLWGSSILTFNKSVCFAQRNKEDRNEKTPQAAKWQSPSADSLSAKGCYKIFPPFQKGRTFYLLPK